MCGSLLKDSSPEDSAGAITHSCSCSTSTAVEFVGCQITFLFPATLCRIPFDVLQLWHHIHCSTSYTVLYASLTLSHLGQLCKTHTAICLLSPDTLDTYLVLLQSLQSA